MVFPAAYYFYVVLRSVLNATSVLAALSLACAFGPLTLFFTLYLPSVSLKVHRYIVANTFASACNRCLPPVSPAHGFHRPSPSLPLLSWPSSLFFCGAVFDGSDWVGMGWDLDMEMDMHVDMDESMIDQTGRGPLLVVTTIAVAIIALQSPLPLVNAHADEIVEFLLHILASDTEMNLKDSSALVSHSSSQ